jgi:hypothetical protein
MKIYRIVLEGEADKCKKFIQGKVVQGMYDNKKFQISFVNSTMCKSLMDIRGTIAYNQYFNMIKKKFDYDIAIVFNRKREDNYFHKFICAKDTDEILDVLDRVMYALTRRTDVAWLIK